MPICGRADRYEEEHFGNIVICCGDSARSDGNCSGRRSGEEPGSVRGFCYDRKERESGHKLGKGGKSFEIQSLPKNRE